MQAHEEETKPGSVVPDSSAQYGSCLLYLVSRHIRITPGVTTGMIPDDDRDNWLIKRFFSNRKDTLGKRHYVAC
jgi:hypothetical protein